MEEPQLEDAKLDALIRDAVDRSETIGCPLWAIFGQQRQPAMSVTAALPLTVVSFLRTFASYAFPKAAILGPAKRLAPEGFALFREIPDVPLQIAIERSFVRALEANVLCFFDISLGPFDDRPEDLLFWRIDNLSLAPRGPAARDHLHEAFSIAALAGLRIGAAILAN